jgi:class 3 adenylate cyclase/tetratricopeptide (TPR) repeat protein
VEAERRQVTILFADMVNFTPFSERSGEEAAFTLMQSLAKLMEEAVREEGGVVQGFTGDGIMAVFGAPVAYEDAPLRACRSALAILERLKTAGASLEAKHKVRPELRIGLNSGPAIVGKVQGGAEAGATVLGDTVNFAARLQSLAAPSSAIMSEGTYRLVDGLVEASFVREHQVKGKADAQKTYRLDGIRERARGFDAKVDRGLTRYVGRDRELETLERGLDAIGDGLQVFDIVGEPGIGKSRLVHEFIGQVVKERARVLRGSCAPDGQQTPFRAFIEIVRGAFRVSPHDGDVVVARKLDEGLQGLGLHQPENLGLLLHLLGLKPPAGALDGLDGVLIGLRTRELLQRLAQARGRLTPLILVFEDIHWLDSASEDLLAKMAAIGEPLQLLILHTRRPEYTPSWGGHPHVKGLPMGLLSARETARIAEARLGVDQLPEKLAKLITAKADGNPLFAEEIASFLVERGIILRSSAELVFDPAAVAAALPESVQSLLASRVDRLAHTDRSLLQAAAVVGRRFDPDLVAAVGGVKGNAQASFAAMEALDLVHRADDSDEYVFKHALVRDAVYNGLLSKPRAALHLKVAEELESRGGNRLIEIAESLAHHYAQTSRSDKAFTYLAMAGSKSLDVYAIAEAEQYYRQALSMFDENSVYPSGMRVSQVVLRLLETLLLKDDYRQVGLVAHKFMPLIKQAGETPELVVAYYYHAESLLQNLQIVAAHELMTEALRVAERLGDGNARAYARGCLLHTRITLGLDSLGTANRMKAEMMDDSLRFGDNFIRNWSYWFVAWDYVSRGLLKEAREAATQLFSSGEQRNDPRAIGLAHWLLGSIDSVGDLYADAAVHATECLQVAIAPHERLHGSLVRAASAIFSGRPGEGLEELDALFPELEGLGALYTAQWGYGARGAALVMLGRISEGISIIEQQIARCDAMGDQVLGAWARIILAEIYIEILSGRKRPAVAVVFKNFGAIVRAMIFGADRSRMLLQQAAVKQLSQRGITMARINFDLGILSAMKKKGDEAKSYFEKARIAAESQGADKFLQRIDTALAELP